MPKIRYRDHAGSTFRSQAAIKHLKRLGQLLYVRGYIYAGTYGHDAAVIVRGINGTCRFSGFSWGYGGTGPNGLKHMLTQIGVKDNLANTTAFNTPWDTNTVGEKWRIKLS